MDLDLAQHIINLIVTMAEARKARAAQSRDFATDYQLIVDALKLKVFPSSAPMRELVKCLNISRRGVAFVGSAKNRIENAKQNRNSSEFEHIISEGLRLLELRTLKIPNSDQFVFHRSADQDIRFGLLSLTPLISGLYAEVEMLVREALGASRTLSNADMTGAFVKSIESLTGLEGTRLTLEKLVNAKHPVNITAIYKTIQKINIRHSKNQTSIEPRIADELKEFTNFLETRPEIQKYLLMK